MYGLIALSVMVSLLGVYLFNVAVRLKKLEAVAKVAAHQTLSLDQQSTLATSAIFFDNIRRQTAQSAQRAARTV